MSCISYKSIFRLNSRTALKFCMREFLKILRIFSCWHFSIAILFVDVFGTFLRVSFLKVSFCKCRREWFRRLWLLLLERTRLVCDNNWWSGRHHSSLTLPRDQILLDPGTLIVLKKSIPSISIESTQKQLVLAYITVVNIFNHKIFRKKNFRKFFRNLP